jgi:hypothetical protein
MDLAETTNAVSESSFLFLEEQQVFSLIHSFSDPVADHDASLSQLRTIFDKYLECPTLLDPSLERMVAALAVIDNNDYSLGHCLSALSALCKVRGRKLVQRFLPCGVEDVQPVWMKLQEMTDSSSSNTSSSLLLWESVAMLWHWLGALSRIPFDWKIIADNQNFIRILIQRAEDTQTDPGPVRQAAAVCLGAWYCRPDLECELDAFVGLAQTKLLQTTTTTCQFTRMSILETLNTLLKQSPVREQLKDKLGPILWNDLLHLDAPSSLQKLLVKWWTRMTCAYLPPRIAPWRYQRGKRSLVDNLTSRSAQDAKLTSTDKSDSTSEFECVAMEDELFDVPDQVEEGIGRLIEALGHSSTIVRWSAAKGVGRITERLPAICAHDVLDAVLEYFEEDSQNDAYWHGACLAIAELARRGLLLPSRLGDVVPYIVAAVKFDLPRGNASVGVHVRDAACYTYWAFARAYSPLVMRPYLTELSEAIVLTSLFDREVNCRRSASASFQEAVGRQGSASFPNGIAVLTTADYFSLGNRSNAYTAIAKTVAGFSEYRRPIIQHLHKVKLSHWDKHIRELSAKSLHNLTPLDVPFMGESVLPYLLEKSLDQTLSTSTRHGAVLGVAEIILALSEIGDVKTLITEKCMVELIKLVPFIDKKRLYRGRGGENMRSAVCRLVECISRAKIELQVKDQVALLDSVDASIPHPLQTVQESACVALQWLMTTYFPVSEKGPTVRLQTRVVDKFVNMVNNSENPAATRGYSLALGYLPMKLLAPSKSVLDSILLCLCKAARSDTLVGGEPDAETRRNTLMAITRIINLFRVHSVSESFPSVTLDRNQISGLINTFFIALEDYKSDRRGDVGSWSRMAAMDALTLLCLDVDDMLVTNSAGGDSLQRTRVLGALLKQLCEKLDTVRQCAGENIMRIATFDSGTTGSLSYKSEVEKIFDLQLITEERRWGDPSWAFPRAMQVASLDEPVYFQNVVDGIVISVGDLTKSASENACTALLDWAKSKKGTQGMNDLGERLLVLLHLRRRETRIVRPVLKTLKLLLIHQCMDELLLIGDFSKRLMDSLADSAKDCNDVVLLLLLVDVVVSLLCTIPGSRSDTRNDAMVFLCQTLSHAFPRVRSFTAEQLYVLLLEQNSSVAVQDILANTPWIEEHADVTQAAKEVADGLKLLRT